MSELGKRKNFSQYDCMATEELQEILRKHAHNELDTEPDTEPVANSDTVPSSEPPLLKNVRKNVLRNQKEGTRGGQVIE